MPVLSCYVDDRTHGALIAASQELGRTVEELAEAAISEVALQAELSETRRRVPHVPDFETAGEGALRVLRSLQGKR